MVLQTNLNLFKSYDFDWIFDLEMEISMYKGVDNRLDAGGFGRKSSIRWNRRSINSNTSLSMVSVNSDDVFTGFGRNGCVTTVKYAITCGHP